MIKKFNMRWLSEATKQTIRQLMKKRSCYIDENEVCHTKRDCEFFVGSLKKEMLESKCKNFPKCKKCEVCFRQ